MDRIINPYNALAFYTEVLEEQEEAPVFSPQRRIPPWQIEFDDAEVSGAPSVKIIDSNFSDALTLSFGASLTNTATDDGKRYITYKGISDLSTTLNEGLYRVKITTASATYYSHPICVSNAFQQMEFQIVAIPVATSGGFAVNIGNFSKDPNMESNFEINQGNGWQWLGGPSGSIDNSEIIGTGVVDIGLRRNVFYPDGSLVYKEYSLEVDTDASGAGSLSAALFGGRNYDNYCYLEFYNSTDIESVGLFYQDDYKQKVYFHAAYAFPDPVIEDTFLVNGQNVPQLETAAIAEQINMDVYPLPDYLITVLQSVRAHDTITLVTCADEKRMTLTNFRFTPRRADNDNKTIGRITAEVKRVFVKGCAEDKTLA